MRCGAIRYGIVRRGEVRCGAARCGTVRYGMVRCGEVRCGAATTITNDGGVGTRESTEGVDEERTICYYCCVGVGGTATTSQAHRPHTAAACVLEHPSPRERERGGSLASTRRHHNVTKRSTSKFKFARYLRTAAAAEYQYTRRHTRISKTRYLVGGEGGMKHLRGSRRR